MIKQVKIRIYKTLILPVGLYGCESWSLTLRVGHRLRVFENSVLKRIFEPKRNEVTREWRGLQNEELHSLYASPSIIRMVTSKRISWQDVYDIYEEMERVAYKIPKYCRRS
jgi:hypothetical protein